MPVTLDQILATTREGLPALAARRRLLERDVHDALPPADFGSALRRPTVALIAEVKRRSPSAGSIREDLDPARRAADYAAAGAAAISVLTDGPFFGGSVEDLRAVAAAITEPVLRKDFILAEEQVLEARGAGASAVLLIVRALDRRRLRDLLRFTASLHMAALVEVHTEGEVHTALEAGARIVGVNSRDLDTFRIDTEAAWRLLSLVPPDVVAVAESGMATVADVEQAAVAGADAVLVGTALSRAESPTGLVTAIAAVARRGR